ncbi:MAG: T9SS type A sorting domain-containing protein [Bacteroidetes bacterium]|nr:T9SS type A sorting domain-containing protein [Bacteroidota bacterium]
MSNPAYDNVIIEYSDLQNPELTIYNITGELLILINKITTPQSINILSYPSGIYFFELSNENKSITGFFIKD